MRRWIRLYSATLFLFLIIDLIWIGVVGKNFYKGQIGHLMAPDVRWGAALLFYLIYLFGLLYFVVAPSLKEGSSKRALLVGSLFGFICYATYDLTNLATLDRWPVKIVIYDLIWGALLSGIVSYISFYLYKKLFK